MVVHDPKGLPPARAFVKLRFGGTTSSGTLNTPGTVYQGYSNALVGTNTTNPPPASRFNYAYTWGNMYQFYTVHASKIRLEFQNVQDQAGYLFLWPTLMGGTTTTLFPGSLANSMAWPLVKYKRFNDGSLSNNRCVLEYYVTMKELVGADYYNGSEIVGVLPYDGSTGYSTENGTVPNLKVYWQFCWWSTNALNSGEIAGDWTVQIDNFCELTQPCSDRASSVIIPFTNPNLVPQSERPGTEPTEPLLSKLILKDGVVTQEEVILNPKPLDQPISGKSPEDWIPVVDQSEKLPVAKYVDSKTFAIPLSESLIQKIKSM